MFFTAMSGSISHTVRIILSYGSLNLGTIRLGGGQIMIVRLILYIGIPFQWLGPDALRMSVQITSHVSVVVVMRP